ncbi:baeRF2 domain-containing protein [Flindersiella endophytica]
MKPTHLQDIYDSSGPFATAYLEAVRPDASSSESVNLRWRALCEHLTGKGADAETIAAMTEAVEALAPGRVAARGLVLVASGGALLLSDSAGTADGGDRARWAPLPDLGRYIRSKVAARRQVLAVVDRSGADLLVRDVTYSRYRHVEGRSHPLHKVRGGGWAHKRLQNTVDEVSERNAATVAEEITRVVAQAKPAAIVLAGEVDARSRVYHHIPQTLRERVTVTDRGARAPGGNEDLSAVMEDVAAEVEEREREELRERLESGLSTEAAVQDTTDVLAAFRHSAVEALLYLMNENQAGPFVEQLEAEVAIGPEPIQLARTADELRATYTEDLEVIHDKLDSAVIRAAIMTDAEIEVVDTESWTGPVAALLRFPTPVTVPGPRSS